MELALAAMLIGQAIFLYHFHRVVIYNLFLFVFGLLRMARPYSYCFVKLVCKFLLLLLFNHYFVFTIIYCHVLVVVSACFFFLFFFSLYFSFILINRIFMNWPFLWFVGQFHKLNKLMFLLSYLKRKHNRFLFLFAFILNNSLKINQSAGLSWYSFFFFFF